MKILNIPELKFLKVALEKNPKANFNFEYLEKSNAIATLILNYNATKTLLVNQYRPGAKKNIFEIPAGLIDAGEEPIDTLFREVREETGYEKKDFEIIYASKDGFYVSPGYTTEKIFIYIIKLKSDDIIPKELKLDDGEDLFPQWFNLDEVSKVSNDMKTIFALNIYKNLS
ncbi:MULTISPECIES: NUDIX hydrolase [Fusobacterium]|uniref:NUDIX hydrolase n=1 Tax=Fusobacterium TaxID=848 RepID=UPI001F4FD4C4|nr:MULTISPECIES: NUDIX hydrolase [Fusobacterium]MCI5725142.1 NUDIX hydrolase [Fusobacterium sp.]MDY5305583.1 NUDIX hydrolase [Fusobacterium gastrosuis]